MSEQIDILPYLDAIDALYSDPSKWTQGWFSRDEFGQECSPYEAVCWCLSGAVDLVTRDARDRHEARNEVTNALNHEFREPENFVKWQDDYDRTFEEVKALIRRTRDRIASEVRR